MKMQAGWAMLATLACAASVRGQIQAESHNKFLNWFAQAGGITFHEELGYVGTYGMEQGVEVGSSDPYTTLSLQLGQIVGPAITWTNYPELGITDSDLTSLCEWCPWKICGGKKFLPVRRAIAPGEYQYGWIRIAVTGWWSAPPTPLLCQGIAYRTLFFYDSAFELTPNTPIVAGDKGCVADCDGSFTLSIDDFICFQTLFALKVSAADCDVSGDLSIDDFICFQTSYALGC